MDIINEINNYKEQIFSNLSLPFEVQQLERGTKNITIRSNEQFNSKVKYCNLTKDSIKVSNTIPLLKDLNSRIDIVGEIFKQITSEISRSIFKNFLNNIIASNNIDYIYIPTDKSKLESEKNEFFIKELLFKNRRSGMKNSITSALLASEISDSFNFNFMPQNGISNGNGSTYKIGSLSDMNLWVDPYLKYDDNRLFQWDKAICYISFESVIETVDPMQFQTWISIVYNYYIDLNFLNVTYYLRDQSSEGYSLFISDMRDKKIDQILDGRE